MSSILALDVGGARIGVAIASSVAKIARPLITLDNDETFTVRLSQIIADEGIGILVVGLPRNLSGEETPQTEVIKDFATKLEMIGVPIYFQDEAVTSAQAEAELENRGKPYSKGDIDALAATYILEDFLQTYKEDA